NITHSGSGEISRFLGLYPTDVNADGITEIPEPIAFATKDEESDIYYRIGWRQYSSDGAAQIVQNSFHNAQDGWNLILPEEQDSNISVQRDVLTDETVVLFSRLRGENTPAQPLLAIYAITGDDREFRAGRADRFLLARQVDTLYAAELFTDETDEQTLRNNFSLITAEWKTGEN
ncbi:MAG: VCBS repeat-containing protein, partial [Clostridia bacterium]|nr:VCBS repeat-containing protein [Clostridia bacterium]